MKNLLPLILIVILGSCSMKKKADYIFVNARVYTVNNHFEIADAFAVKDGVFIAVGKEAEVLANCKSDSVIDLEGNAVFPGFIDAHCHFYGYGVKFLAAVDLKNTKSFKEILELIKNHPVTNKSEWIEGRGWDQNNWANDAFPDKTELDKIFPDNPVILTRVDGHMVLVNSAAITKLGITEAGIANKKEALYKGGKFTGVFMEKTADLFKAAIPEPTAEATLKGLLRAQEDCYSVGLTTVADAGLSFKVVKLIDSLQKAKVLTMRIYAMLDPNEENLKGYIEKGPYTTEYLNVRSVKLYADGALGSRGACLLQPYTDDTKNYGLMVTTDDIIRKWCTAAQKYGYQVNTHCIGDSANRHILHIYSEYLKGKNDLRWRIEHCQVVDRNDISLFGKYSVVPSIQATHATSDMYWAGERLGSIRVKNAYAYQDLMNQNGFIANGTDFPIESINPINTFFASVARTDLQNFPDGGYQFNNGLLKKEAIRSMTIWAARACFEEKEKGSIEDGKYADFVVLDQDIIKGKIVNAPKAKVLKTYVAGKKVFQSK